MALKITKDDDHLIELGIESLNVGYNFMYLEKDSCSVQVICELKVVQDKKFKGGYTLSFALIDNRGQFVGATQEWVGDRKDYYKVGLITNNTNCSINAKKLTEIKVYVQKT